MSRWCAAVLAVLVMGSVGMVPGAQSAAGAGGLAGGGFPVGVGVVATGCGGYGHTDIAAVGSPRRDGGAAPDAGVVVVRRPNAGDDPGTLLTAADVGGVVTPNDQFGSATAWADLTVGDRVEEPLYTRMGSCPDLVIGVPGADGGRGALVVVPDFGAGLEPARAVWLRPKSLALAPGDGLGAAVGASRVYDTAVTPAIGVTMLVAGVPGRDLPTVPNAGALVVWAFPEKAVDPATPMSMPAPGDEWTLAQGSDGVMGRAERADRFGSVISSGTPLVVGVPKEDIGRRSNAGAVHTLTFTANGRQVSDEMLWLGHGLPGKPKTGDQLGAAVYADWVIGIPGRDSNGRKDSGAVLVKWRWSESRDPSWRTITQDTRGVPDRSERSDRFGAAVTWLRGRRGAETSAVAIGVPGEDYGRRRNVGAVTYVDLFNERTDAEGRWAYATQQLPAVSSSDAFGSSFVRVPGDPAYDEDTTDTLLAGAPGEDVNGVRDAGRYWLLGPTPPVAFASGTKARERMGL